MLASYSFVKPSAIPWELHSETWSADSPSFFANPEALSLSLMAWARQEDKTCLRLQLGKEVSQLARVKYDIIKIIFQYEKLRENQVRYRETVSLQHLKDPIATQDFASWFAILKGNLQPSWHMNWEVHHCPYPEKISASAISVLGLDFELGLFQLYLLDRAGNTTSLQSKLFSFLNLLGDF